MIHITITPSPRRLCRWNGRQMFAVWQAEWRRTLKSPYPAGFESGNDRSRLRPWKTVQRGGGDALCVFGRDRLEPPIDRLAREAVAGDQVLDSPLSRSPPLDG